MPKIHEEELIKRRTTLSQLLPDAKHFSSRHRLQRLFTSNLTLHLPTPRHFNFS